MGVYGEELTVVGAGLGGMAAAIVAADAARYFEEQGVIAPRLGGTSPARRSTGARWASTGRCSASARTSPSA